MSAALRFNYPDVNVNESASMSVIPPERGYQKFIINRDGLHKECNSLIEWKSRIYDTNDDKTTVDDEVDLTSKVFRKIKPNLSSFIAEQEWEGFVTEIKSDSFVARLIDLTSPGVEEEGVFEIECVSDNDKQLMKVGAVFRWALGYERSPSGTKKKVSQVVFRRLPAWSKRDIDESNKEAAMLAAFFSDSE